MLPYFFAIPAVASIVILWRSWRDGPFRRPWLLAVACALFALVQFQSPILSRSWLAAVLAQVALAIYMAVRRALPRPPLRS